MSHFVLLIQLFLLRTVRLLASSVKWLPLLSLCTLLSCVSVQQDNVRITDKKKALESYVTLGNAYLKRGNRDAAMLNFEKALDIDKRSPQANNGMGLLYRMIGEFELSEKSFLKALRRDSSYSQARVNYGIFLYQDKRYSKAYKQFVRVSKDITYSRRALVLAYVGQTALKLGNVEKAKSSFEHALNIDENLPLPLLELAVLNFDQKNYAEAKQYLDRYTAVAKPSPQSLWLGIRIERIFGNKDKEASYALALKNLHPYSKEYLEYQSLLKQ